MTAWTQGLLVLLVLAALLAALAACSRPQRPDPVPVLVFCDGAVVCIPI